MKGVDIIKDTLANRLQKALNLTNTKPIELANKTKIDKSVISNYLSGKYKPGDDNLKLLADSLDVSEMWLLGYDVPIKENINNNFNSYNELDLLYDKSKDILNDAEINVIKTVMKDAIERQQNNK